MTPVQLVPTPSRILTYLLAVILLIGPYRGLSADDPSKTQTGIVEISLKLLPSAPETPSQAETDNKPSDPPKTGDNAVQAVPVAIQPLKKPVRPLKIAIEPLPGEENAAPNNVSPPADSGPLQATDQVNTEECPGGQVESNEAAGELPLLPGDVPLEQEEHPFEVPEAISTAVEPRLLPASKSDDSPTPELNETEDLDTEDLKLQIENLLQYYRDHPESVVRRGPWAIMHAILPYGVETEIIAGNRRVNAIGWLCHNGVSARQRMFQPTQSGFRPNLGPGVQGHEGQFLAILAQSRVQSDYPLKVGKRKYSIRDLVRYEMATCRERSELTFKLIAFSHYLEPDQTWKDNRGRSWSIEKLLAEELAQPITGSACGGTHRLMGLACALIRRQEAGLPITGHFQRAQVFLDDFVVYTLSLQNPDGSFSTEWFERRANEANPERKIQTTGHILEWLVYTLPDEHLSKPEITKAVQFLVGSIGAHPERDWPIGPRSHSLRALALYHQRMFAESSQGSEGDRVASELSNEPVDR